MEHQTSNIPPPPPSPTTQDAFTPEYNKPSEQTTTTTTTTTPTKSSPAQKFIEDDNVKEKSKRNLRQQLLEEKSFYEFNGNDDFNERTKDADDDSSGKDDDKDMPTKEIVAPLAFYKLFRYAGRWELILYLIGILGAIATGLTIPANSLIFGNLANSMILFGDPDKPLDGDSILLAVETFAIQNAIAGTVLLACSYISVTAFNYAAHSQIFRIRSRFFQSVLHQDMSWYDVHQSGEIASQMNEDLSKIEEGLGEKVVMFLHFIFAFIGCIALAFTKGWQLALVCLSSLPVTFLAMGIVGVATSKLAKKELQVYGVAGAVAEEALSNIRTVKAFEGEFQEISTYKERIVDARNLNIKRSLLSGVGFGLLWFFIYASYALAFWYGVGLVLKNYAGDDYYSNYDPGTMIMIFFSVMMGSMNMGMASPYIEAFGIAKGAAAKVYKLIEQKPFINPIEGMGRQLSDPLNYIEFQDVVFYYPTRQSVTILNNFNLRIRRGETVALVGASGCGKSTCIQLLQRFYDPVDGSIYLNGINLKDINTKWLRSRIGVVGQEPILFGTSIYENIRYGLETATREDIEKAAEAANALGFIKKLPKGFDTLVGERGAQLSGGQKQRIAIARALVRNPEVLLLDEATSALDTSSETKVQRALETASKGRTTIIVAHRLSTIFHADRIVVIQNGTVVETGSHLNLMARQQHYYQLVTAQLREDDTQLNAGISKADSLSLEKHEIKEDQAVVQEEDDDEVIHFTMDTNEMEEINNKAEEAKFSIWTIIKLNRKEWPQILFGCFSSIINGFGMPLFALLFGSMLQVLAVRSDPVYIRENTNTLSMYLALSGLLTGMATFIQIFAFGIAGEKLTERLRGLMFEAMLKMEVAWFDERTNGTGSLCSRLSSDAAAIQGATGQRIGTVIQAMSTLCFALGLSMYYEWSLGLLALSFAPFILVATFLQRKIMAQENMGTAKTMEESTTLAVEVVSNIRTVNSLGREEMFHQKYINILRPAVATAKRNTHYRGFVYGLARSLMFYAYAACIYYGGWCVVNKDMEFGNVFKVSQAIIMGTTSIAGALAFAPNFQKGMSAAHKIYRLLTRQPKIIDSALALQTIDKSWICEGNVSFEKVEFTYPTRSQIKVLRELSCEFPKGQKIALVGPSGCGKSTCIQLLQRFYDVDSGKVAIDRYDVRHLRLETLRKQMGIVSQEPVLFDRTMRENIAYGDNTRAVNMIEIIDAAKKANIHNFISSLPLGYETRMGEKGTHISGGQKQRIAIARALIRNPKILLLDEATSALDAESEKIVQDALNVASQGRTTISIAHRLSTVMDCDQIFVIDNGKIREYGTHKDLMEIHGLYYSLYKLQSL